ncbi:hypothetical protein DFP72DRAFT_1176332 [Ephemerocybe angulata]|uniref:Uncharacterized protein n=1 Tax=Ephemerocybe angulata TaxID=980116 RepID=A0A8H6HE56_9AGAR|nr:hypothetical protein DFP72DRAFT_1176332 [Tulosesus angulatus]
MFALLNAPISLYTLPLAWLFAYLPQVYRVKLMKQVKVFDNDQPRQILNKISAKEGVDAKLKAKIARVEGAHYNGLESYPLWSIAVLAANVAGLNQRAINLTAGVYLGSRVVYNYIYIKQTRRWHTSMRTLVWLVGVGSSISLLVRSGNLVSSA